MTKNVDENEASSLRRTTKRQLWKKALVNVFLVVLIPSFILDAFPTVGHFRCLLKYQYRFRPYLAVLGLWQERWELFAPL
jgi:arginine exporter protein ArgO